MNTWSDGRLLDCDVLLCLALGLRGIFSVWREISIPKTDCLRKAFAASGKKKLDRFLFAFFSSAKTACLGNGLNWAKEKAKKIREDGAKRNGRTVVVRRV